MKLRMVFLLLLAALLAACGLDQIDVSVGEPTLESPSEPQVVTVVAEVTPTSEPMEASPSPPPKQDAPAEPTPTEETAVTEQATPDPGTLVVRSFPPGAEAYVVPKKVAEGMLGGSVILTSDEYFVGYTPAETELEPGVYYVTVEHEPAHFRDDGEDEVIFQIIDKEDQERTITQIAKVYIITKSDDHQTIVTALLWPEDQSLAEFVETLPDDELFTISNITDEDFEVMLQTHKVPEEDWENLLTMFRRTGKAAWHGEDLLDYFFIYCEEPHRLVVKQSVEAQQ